MVIEHKDKEYSQYLEGLGFSMDRIRRPSVPDRSVSLADFGGSGDGVTLNSEAFRKAIDALSSQGGGHLLVPAGIWLTGPVTLKSNIDLHLASDAVIVFSADRSLYPVTDTVFEGVDTRRCLAQINAFRAENISITGKGTIDGSGDSWRHVRKTRVSPLLWKRLVSSGGITDASGEIWYPDASSFRGAAASGFTNIPKNTSSVEEWESVKTFLRPVTVGFRECRGVLLEGVLFQNSPCWNIHPLMCSDVIVDGITVRNPAHSQNGDGIDIDSCCNVLLVNSVFDVGDDAVCIKSGRDEEGRRRACPSRNIVVRDCTVFHGYGGFVVGSEMSGGVSDVSVSGCRFFGTDVGLRFKSCLGRGGTVENISISDILMTDIKAEPVLFDLHYGKHQSPCPSDAGRTVADEAVPVFRNIHIDHITCRGAARAMFFNGIPERCISDVDIRDCHISATEGADIRYSDDLKFTNVRLHQKIGPGFRLLNCRGVLVDGCFDSSGALHEDRIDLLKSEEVSVLYGKA